MLRICYLIRMFHCAVAARKINSIGNDIEFCCYIYVGVYISICSCCRCHTVRPTHESISLVRHRRHRRTAAADGYTLSGFSFYCSAFTCHISKMTQRGKLRRHGNVARNIRIHPCRRCHTVRPAHESISFVRHRRHCRAAVSREHALFGCSFYGAAFARDIRQCETAA